ncbi:MAG: hypothetical protein CMK92_04655 [Pseudomonas sp.]|nr:hypothetical protein [Pseudomonas sp.]
MDVHRIKRHEISKNVLVRTETILQINRKTARRPQIPVDFENNSIASLESAQIDGSSQVIDACRDRIDSVSIVTSGNDANRTATSGLPGRIDASAVTRHNMTDRAGIAGEFVSPTIIVISGSTRKWDIQARHE